VAPNEIPEKRLFVKIEYNTFGRLLKNIFPVIKTWMVKCISSDLMPPLLMLPESF
jgi:hypothetical protein